MRIKFNWSVNGFAINESSLRQKFISILGLSNIKLLSCASHQIYKEGC